MTEVDTTADSSLSEASDASQIKIEVSGYDGGTATSSLIVGDWRPATAGVISTTSSASEFVSYSSLPSVATTGDDLLAPFLDLTFIDDSRDRGYDTSSDSASDGAPATDYKTLAKAVNETATAPYLQANRAATTKSIPDYVGWRDHTDGHRISTTRGDKIEVIGGNYKLIVLGRGSGTVATDASGGQLIDVLEAPGNVTSVNWRTVPAASSDKGWQWVEETVKGNVINRYHGTYKEEFYGDQMVTVVGNNPGTASPDRYDKTSSTAPKGDWDTTNHVANKWDGTDSSVTAANDPGIPANREQPVVKEMVWAQSIDSDERISGTKWDKEWAGSVFDYVGCDPASPTGFDSDGWDGSPDWSSGTQPSTVHAFVNADNILEVSQSKSFKEYFNSGSYLFHCTAQDSGDPSSATETWKANFIERFDGIYFQLVLGFSTTAGLGNRLEVYIGGECQINLGVLMEARIGPAYELETSEAISTMKQLKAYLSSWELGHGLTGTAIVNSWASLVHLWG